MMRSQFLIALLSVSIQICFVLSIAANTNGSQVTVRGRIVDRDQAVVVGADVTATRTTDKASVVVRSNNAGEFALTLTPGDYILEASAIGFKSRQLTLRVSPDSQEDIVIDLEIASATATVTVTDGGQCPATPITSATKTFWRFAIFHNQFRSSVNSRSRTSCLQTSVTLPDTSRASQVIKARTIVISL